MGTWRCTATGMLTTLSRSCTCGISRVFWVVRTVGTWLLLHSWNGHLSVDELSLWNVHGFPRNLNCWNLLLHPHGIVNHLVGELLLGISTVFCTCWMGNAWRRFTIGTSMIVSMYWTSGASTVLWHLSVHRHRDICKVLFEILLGCGKSLALVETHRVHLGLLSCLDGRHLTLHRNWLIYDLVMCFGLALLFSCLLLAMLFSCLLLAMLVTFFCTCSSLRLGMLFPFFCTCLSLLLGTALVTRCGSALLASFLQHHPIWPSVSTLFHVFLLRTFCHAQHVAGLPVPYKTPPPRAARVEGASPELVCSGSSLFPSNCNTACLLVCSPHLTIALDSTGSDRQHRQVW